MRKERRWGAELHEPQRNKAVYENVESNGLRWH